jgi:hypothetical protein
MAKFGDDFEKSCKIGIDAHNMGVYIEIKLDNGRLSISGHARLNSRTDYAYCGQIQDEINMKNITRLRGGYDWRKLGRLLEIWDEWHLNDMRPECEHQHKLMPAARERNGEDFFNAANLTNIWGIPEFRQCPECGYKYGTAWKKAEVPAEVLEFLRSF